MLAPAKVAARKPTKVSPIWMVARNSPGLPSSRSTRRAPRFPRRPIARHASVGREPARTRRPRSRPLRKMRIAMMRISNSGLGPRRSRLGGLTTSLADARRQPHGDLARRHVPGHHRARAGVGTLADGDRRAQDRVRADERPIADGRAVFALAVVVGGDRPGADVDALADLRVAEVAEVVLLDRGRRSACSSARRSCRPRRSSPTSQPAAKVGEGPNSTPLPTIDASITTTRSGSPRRWSSRRSGCPRG